MVTECSHKGIKRFTKCCTAAQMPRTLTFSSQSPVRTSLADVPAFNVTHSSCFDAIFIDEQVENDQKNQENGKETAAVHL